MVLPIRKFYDDAINFTEMKVFVMPSSNSGFMAALLGATTFASANPFIVTSSAPPGTQQGAKLVGTGAVGAAYQGWSLSLSADGNTLAVGGREDNTTSGATWIFTRSGSTWTQQGSKLVGSGAVGAAAQGTSVSLSASGNTLVVGGIEDNSSVGATWVFTP